LQEEKDTMPNFTVTNPLASPVYVHGILEGFAGRSSVLKDQETITFTDNTQVEGYVIKDYGDRFTAMIRGVRRSWRIVLIYAKNVKSRKELYKEINGNS
jgi:hypothetical protein